MDYDIIIVGGGISGAVAAISAARCGSKVLVIERDACMGGTMTSCEVGPMMTFHVGDKQVIRGITGEIVERLVRKGKSEGHIYDMTRTASTITPFETEALKLELDIMLDEAGGKILYHSMLCGITAENGNITGISVCTKNGIINLSAKMYIDATGDGDLFAMAGVPFTQGREEDGITQPMTLMMRMVNVDFSRLKESVTLYPEEFPSYQNISLWENAPKMAIGCYVKRIKQAQKEGRISFDRGAVLVFETNIPGEAIINTSRVQGLNPTDIYELSKAEAIGRQQAYEIEKFLIEECPGFEKARLLRTGSRIGVRTSRQLVGRYTVTFDDLASQKKFDDVIAYGGYPVDIHSSDGKGGIKKFEPGTIYGVPYRALINEKIENLITVGRCISAEFTAVGALRVSPMAGAIGHAGGVAAHLAAKENLKASEVPYMELKNILLSQGAYLRG